HLKNKFLVYFSRVKRCLVIILICCLSFGISGAQDISGFWKGSLTIPNGCFISNNIEIQITLKGNTLTGNSYHYRDIDNYIKKNATGSYDRATKTVSINEIDVTTYHIPTRCIICIKNYRLHYSKEGNQEMLSGEWTGNIMGTDSACGPGTLTLYRIKESAFKAIPEIAVDTGVIRLDFYDNGVVDGDSITVMANNKVIVSHHRLTTKPGTAYIKIDEHNTFQEIEMIAENLGSIIPNTALLIITAGNKRYRLFLSSSKQKSAKVRFVFDKNAVLKKDKTEGDQLIQ
ncbi:MAG: hypothetical protein ABIN74_13690, partial [Ferruginibacter sp.]